jgi:hypothetical protein
VIDERAVLAPYIRRLHIKLSESKEASMFYQSLEPSDPGFEQLPAPKANVSAFALKLEDAFSRLPQLEDLAITMKENWRSEVVQREEDYHGYGVFQGVSDDSDDEERRQPSQIFDLDLLYLIRSNLARVFSSPRIQLSFLKDLV